VPRAEFPLQLRLGAVVADESDFAMSVVLSVTVVAIEGFLSGVLRDLLDAWVGHLDEILYRLRRETESVFQP
jgi:hypothetical protein